DTGKEVGAGQTSTEEATGEDGERDGGKGGEEVVDYVGDDKAGGPVADEDTDAGGEKIALEGGAKAFRRPVAERAVDDDRRSVDAVSSAENAREEAEEPGETVVFEAGAFFAEQAIGGESGDDGSEDRFDDRFRNFGEEKQAERDSGEGENDEM